MMERSRLWNFFLITTLFIQTTTGDGTMEFHFLLYKDNCREDINNNKCDPMFTMCVQRPKTSLVISRKTCNYESTGESGYFQNTNYLDLTDMRNIKGLSNPWEITFTTLHDKEVMFVVQVRDDDSISDDHLEKWGFTFEPTVYPTFEDSEWTEYTTSSDGHTFKFNFRIYCTHDTYGPLCTVECPAPTSSSHYICDKETGEKICEKGWKGANCLEVNTECDASNCINGDCIENEGSYTCDCFESYLGFRCDIENTCSSNPCQNGGTCEFHISTTHHSCHCTADWEGVNCEDRRDPCEQIPCKNGGSCSSDLFNTVYTCNCRTEWTGDTCEERRDPCEQIPCKNGGSCSSDPLNTVYTCDCRTEWTGDTCEERRDPCEQIPCKNGGSCSSDALNTIYTCVCRTEWTGDTCEERRDPCEQIPCKNGGSCSSDALNTVYTCDCRTEWTGDTCEERRDPCEQIPCKNGGSCSSDALNTVYTCVCRTEWTGDTCEERRDPCEQIPCKNGGSCSSDPLNTVYTCDCRTEWTGDTCEERRDPCEQIPCKNGGSCSSDALNTVYTCVCRTEWTGDTCEERRDPCEQIPCKNGGSCSSDPLNTVYTCDCRTEWTGDTCEERRDPCEQIPCKNGGSCSSDPLNTVYTCDCRTEWTGDTCEERRDPCEQIPCKNGGSCSSDPLNTVYTCDCRTEWTGDTCEERRDPCEQIPCKNGGSCSSDPLNTVYTCDCRTEWTGDTCEERRDPCEQIPCKNGGSCSSDALNTVYTCVCRTEWTGDTCEERRDPCEQIPCKNGGSCSSDPLNTVYTCDCRTEWTGYTCEERRDPCEEVLCKNNGSCASSEDKTRFACACSYPYTGLFCDHDLLTIESSSSSPSASPGTSTDQIPEAAGQTSTASFPIWIVGLIIASLIVLGFGVFCIVFCRRRKKKKDPDFILPVVKYDGERLAFDNNAYHLANGNKRASDILPSDCNSDGLFDSKLPPVIDARQRNGHIHYDDIDDDGYLKANHPSLPRKLPSAPNTPGSERAADNQYSDFKSLKPKRDDEEDDEVHYHDLDELAIAVNEVNQENPYSDIPSNIPSKKRKQPREEYDFLDPTNIMNEDISMPRKKGGPYQNDEDMLPPAPPTPKRSHSLPVPAISDVPYDHTTLKTKFSDPFASEIPEDDEDLPDFGLPKFHGKNRGGSEGGYETPSRVGSRNGGSEGGYDSPSKIHNQYAKPKTSGGYEVPDSGITLRVPPSSNDKVYLEPSPAEEDEDEDDISFPPPPPPLSAADLEELEPQLRSNSTRPLSLVTGKTGIDENQVILMNDIMLENKDHNSGENLGNDTAQPDPSSNPNFVPLYMENFGFSEPSANNDSTKHGGLEAEDATEDALDADSSKNNNKHIPLVMENYGFSEQNLKEDPKEQVNQQVKNAEKANDDLDTQAKAKAKIIPLYMENLGFSNS